MLLSLLFIYFYFYLIKDFDKFLDMSFHSLQPTKKLIFQHGTNAFGIQWHNLSIKLPGNVDFFYKNKNFLNLRLALSNFSYREFWMGLFARVPKSRNADVGMAR